MRRQDSWLIALRPLIGLILAVLVFVLVRSELGPTWSLITYSGVGGPAQGSPRQATTSKELTAEQTTYPSQATWAWVTSEDHAGAEPILEGASCAKCHKDASAQSGLWPTWADPPIDHKVTFQNFGCQTCHGVIPRPEIAVAGGKGKSG